MTKQNEELTQELVMARIVERPTRFQELAQSRSQNSHRRKTARAIIHQLKADGLIEQIWLDGIPHFVPVGWRPDSRYFQLRIDERCRRTQDGCLEWIGARNQHNNPIMRFKDGKPKTVRHWLWGQHKGKEPNNKTDRIHMTCMNEDCVEPAHMIKRKANYNHKGKTRTMASIIRMSIAGQRKITREDARAIRASSASSRDLAAQYNVSKETINQIRRGATHKEPSMMMFSQLLAA